jgi:hypothetical protein
MKRKKREREREGEREKNAHTYKKGMREQSTFF